jgi:hypothetical protein
MKKRSGRWMVLGAENASTVRDPRSSTIVTSISKRPKDVRAALAPKCIPCYSVSQEMAERECALVECDWSRCDRACISLRPISAPVRLLRS